MLQSYHHFRARTVPQERASQEGSEGREGPFLATSFCFELDSLHGSAKGHRQR